MRSITPWKKALTSIALGLALPLTALSPALANPIEDPNSTGWASVRGYNSRRFSRHFNQKKNQGYRLVDIEVDQVNGRAKYAAVWQTNSDSRGWASRRDLSHQEFSQKWNDYKDKGFRLIDQEVYTVNGQRYYAGVWVENVENLGWASYRNVDSETFSQRFDTYSSQGFRMVDVEAYPTSQGTRYAAVWVKNNDRLGWRVHRGMTSANFSEKFDTYANQGYRLVDIESYRHNNQQRYAGVWVRNTNRRGWKARRGMSSQAFGNYWKTYRDQGYRLTDFEAYATSSGLRYAGVWRQNNQRPSWSARADVDAAVKAHQENFNIPGISVTVMHKGKTVYSRGFGYADIGDKDVAHAGTVYRLASVSKPITAALTMRLDDLGALDITDNTREHVPSLPTFHSHTVEQLMRHRSGIRHYAGSQRTNCEVPNDPDFSDSSGTQYSTATAATALFRSDALMFSPGTKNCYSTHAYTVLGAALEGATGMSYGDLIEQYLNDGLGLSTLRIENRNQSDSNRATLYRTKTSVNFNNTSVTPDNLSWKYPGGGLEASSADVARFGQAILNDTFLSTAARADSFGNGTYSHNGAQRGAQSVIKLNENEDLVIAILTNQQVNVEGAGPGSLANTIEAIVLDQ